MKENRNSSREDSSRKERLTRSQKNAKGKQWYKDMIDHYTNMSQASNKALFGFTNSEGGVLFNGDPSHYDRMTINYNLFNGILNKSDFESVVRPFGDDVGDLPGRFTNKDIVSGKIKALLGLEMKRPFEWRIIAINDEATSRKEKEYFGMIQEYVVNSIIQPIKTQLEQQAMAETEGRELTDDEINQIQQQIAEQLKAMTPPEIKKYMAREHQDPAEVLGNQLINYLLQKEDFFTKTNRILKHGLLSAVECGWVGIINGEPVLKIINPKYLDFDRRRDLETIEDGEWVTYRMSLSPSEVITYFNEDLKDSEIDEIYKIHHGEGGDLGTFSFENFGENTGSNITVEHVEWKSLKAIKFLDRVSPETGEIETLIVDEEYKLNEEFGDIEITTQWIPFRYEGYKIHTPEPIYKRCREVPGQYKDFDNLYECKLSYVGVIYDNMNSEPTCPMDRMKEYQYYYNMVMWKIDLLMASDEGKKIFMDYKAIPKTSGLDFKQFMHYLKVNNLGFLDPSEEGKKISGDVTNAVKEIDMSLVSDIQKYQAIAEYIKQACGKAVGVPDELEGQISADQSVGNTNNTIVNSSNVIEPIFELHNVVKRNLLSALLQTAKVAYSTFPKKKLHYILDDMSLHQLTLDEVLLDNSTFGLFTANSVRASQALDAVKQLSHAAMQNQKAELSDIIKIYKSNTIQEAEELLTVAEQNRMEREDAMQQQQLQAQKESEEAARKFKREEHDMELEKINLEFDRKKDLEITKQLILSMGFNEDKDLDKDGVPDVLEVAKHELNAQIKMGEQEIKQAKLAHDIAKDQVTLAQNDKKLELEAKKIAQKRSQS